MEKLQRKRYTKCITKLKHNKAEGIDGIINEYIKSTKHIMCPLYVKLFNKVLDTGVIPEDWLIGVIVPFYKNTGDTKDVNNYRGITLLSCLGKLFTTMLNVRLTKFCDGNDIIKEMQAGFRQGYSTTDHLFVLKHLIDLFQYKRKRLYCLYVDYRQAFDLVWKNGLWHKLLNVEINGKVIRVIQNMYNNIKSCFSVNQEISDYFVSYTGVRQEETLSPLLFSLYVNDIENHLLESNCDFIKINEAWIDCMLKVLVLMYADDSVILADSETRLNNALRAMEIYCDKWKLDINYRKTKVTIFSIGKIEVEDYAFQFKGDSIEVVDSYKYLGVTMSSNGGFRTCQDQLCQRGKRAMYSLIAMCRKFDLPIDLQLDLFDAMVMPIIMYGCEIWGYKIIKDVENIQVTFLKNVLGVRKTTCNSMVYGELGKFPVNIHVKYRMLSYWMRILSGKQEKLCVIMYKCLFKLIK